MSGALRRYVLVALVVVLASLVYAGSAQGWRRPLGGPINELHACRDGIRFQVAGPTGTTKDMIDVGAEIKSVSTGAVTDTIPSTSIRRQFVKRGHFEVLEDDPRHPEFIHIVTGDPLRPYIGERYRRVRDPIEEIATYSLPWLVQPSGTDKAVTLLLDRTDIPLVHADHTQDPTQTPTGPLREPMDQTVGDCSLVPDVSPHARMVGKGSVSGENRFESCRGGPPVGIPASEILTHTHDNGETNLSHDAQRPTGDCPLQVRRSPVMAAFAYILNCDPRQVGGPRGARFEAHFNGQVFRLTDVHGVSCVQFSGGGTLAAGFNNMRGEGAGTLDGKPANVEWEFTDGGSGGVNDLLRLRIRLPLPGLPDPAPQTVLYELDRTVFTTTSLEDPELLFFGPLPSPGQFPGSNQPTGRNSALPPPRTR